MSPPLAKLVFAFGPAQYTALMLAALAAVTYFSGGALLKALLMVGFGLTIGCIGADPMTLTPRLTFGTLSLVGGIDLTPLAIGLFGFSEIIAMARQPLARLKMIPPPKTLLGFLPNREETRRSIAPVARGTVLGFPVGVLPGGGAMLASFLSYALERKLSRHRKSSAKARSRASPVRRPRTTPAHPARCCRCSAWDCRPTPCRRFFSPPS